MHLQSANGCDSGHLVNEFVTESINVLGDNTHVCIQMSALLDWLFDIPIALWRRHKQATNLK